MSRLRPALVILALASTACASAPILPGESIADPTLQRAASRAVLSADAVTLPPCASGTIVYTEVVEYPETPQQSPWIERWTVEHCGERVAYLVTFTPDLGGTTFRLRHER
jgi:hypothetical protein